MAEILNNQQKADSIEQEEYRVSVRLTKEDFERLERIQKVLQQKKGRSVRVTQRTVIVEVLEIAERELTRSRQGPKNSE